MAHLASFDCSTARTARECCHSDPAFTLRVYAHAMKDEEADVSFADFGSPKRPYTAPADEGEVRDASNYAKQMARREGLEPPTLRFEA
jgi:hypothetical protein